jgi:5-bromo-4-chloroindolyl phosphate hydrolysis protein
MFLKNLANLLKVKTIVTILLTIVFCVLALSGAIAAELFMAVFTTVIAFYFGTQAQKKNEQNAE